MVAMPCVFGSSSVVRGRSCRLFGVGHSALKFESHPLALDPARLASWRLFPALPPLPDFSFLLSKFQLSLGVFGALVVDFRFQFSKLARAARTFRLPLYPPSKNESGKEKVKFFDLYQALTEVEGGGGKEKGSDKVFCQMVKFLTLSHSRQSMARAARTFYILHSSFCLSPLGRAPKTR